MLLRFSGCPVKLVVVDTTITMGAIVIIMDRCYLIRHCSVGSQVPKTTKVFTLTLKLDRLPQLRTMPVVE